MADRRILLWICLLVTSASLSQAEQRAEGAGNTQAAAILAKSRIDLRKDEAYSTYNASGDGTHWRHNARAYLDVGYWSAELMKPMLAKATNHATDQKVQEALKRYDRLFKEGNAADRSPVHEAAMKRRAGKPPKKTAGGNNIR